MFALGTLIKPPKVYLAMMGEEGDALEEIKTRTPSPDEDKRKPAGLTALRPESRQETLPKDQTVIVAFGRTKKECLDEFQAATAGIANIGKPIIASPMEGTAFVAIVPINKSRIPEITAEFRRLNL